MSQRDLAAKAVRPKKIRKPAHINESQRDLAAKAVRLAYQLKEH